MDEKYIEHLGMSQHIDEGLWDRLKSKASAFTQGAKNISGGKLGAVGTTETAKFNSLFRSFVNDQLSIIRSLDKALIPWAQHATPEETAEIQKVEALETALKGIDFGKLPVTEALPSFSNIGARIQGGVTNILNSYKQRLSSTYDSFINDVRKMNIVPDQYISRKIAGGHSGAKEALEALGQVIGKQTVPTAMPSIPSPAPAATSEPPKPSATPTTPAPATPPSSAPAATPEKPETTPETPFDTTGIPTDKLIPPELGARESAEAAVFKLGQQTLNKIITEIPAAKLPVKEAETTGEEDDRSMLSLIKGEWIKNAYKAQHPFPKDPPVYVVSPNGVYSFWDLRWRFEKENHGHLIEISSVDKQRVPTGEFKTLREGNWVPFLRWNIFDVASKETGRPLPNVDYVELITRTNRVFGDAIKKSSAVLKTEFIDAGTAKKLTDALYSIALILAREPERGKKQLGGAETEPERMAASKMSAVTGAPEKPMAPDTLKNVPPQEKGRSGYTAEPEGEPPKKSEEPPSAAPSEPSKPSPTEPTKPVEPGKKPEPEKKPEEPSSKLKDLVPKAAKGGKPKAEKPKAPAKPSPAEPKKTPKADPAVAAPKPAAPTPVVAPAKAPEKPTEPPKPAAPASTAPLGGEDYIVKFNKKYTEPHGLSPLTTRDQIKAFWNAVGVTGTGEVPDWKIKGAHQIVTGTKPAAPAAPATPVAPAAKPKAPPKKKVKEGFEYRDFFS